MYKIGDKVKVREDLITDRKYGDWNFLKYMEKFKGKIVTISYVDRIFGVYEIEEDKYCLNWTEEMFERYEENIQDNTCVCETLNKNDEVLLDNGFYCSLYLEKEENEYRLVGIGEGESSINIKYCPLCGRKL